MISADKLVKRSIGALCRGSARTDQDICERLPDGTAQCHGSRAVPQLWLDFPTTSTRGLDSQVQYPCECAAAASASQAWLRRSSTVCETASVKYGETVQYQHRDRASPACVQYRSSAVPDVLLLFKEPRPAPCLMAGQFAFHRL